MLTRAMMVSVLLMWEGFFRHAVHRWFPGLALFCLVRELLWWRLVALLLTIIVLFAGKSPPFAAVQRLRALA
jgi:hypothetical protein